MSHPGLRYAALPPGRRTVVELHDFPRQLDLTVRDLINRDAWLLPRWLERLSLRYVDDPEPDDDFVLRVAVQPEYRSALLHVHPRFFSTDRSQHERRMNLIHELLHITLEQMGQFTRQELERLLTPESPQFHGAMDEQWRQRVEAVTQDLAIMIATRLAGEEPLTEGCWGGEQDTEALR